MKYMLTTISVADMDRSLEFYHGLLEMPVVHEFTNGTGMRIAMLGNAGEPLLELLEQKTSANPVDLGGLSIGFEVEDPMAIIGKHGGPYEGPISPNPGVTFYFITDPDGYRIQLHER